MNGNFYQNPTFPTNQNQMNNFQTPPGNVSSMEPDYNEQSYIENILRLNKGRKVNAYVSFPDSTEWKNKVFTGLIEEAGKDHLIIKDVTDIFQNIEFNALETSSSVATSSVIVPPPVDG